jgi:hypothetical protein
MRKLLLSLVATAAVLGGTATMADARTHFGIYFGGGPFYGDRFFDNGYGYYGGYRPYGYSPYGFYDDYGWYDRPIYHGHRRHHRHHRHW